MTNVNRSSLVSSVFCMMLCASQVFASDDVLSRALDVSRDNNRQEKKVQSQIDKLDEKTQAMLEEYLRLKRESNSLNQYNDQLQRMVDSQNREKDSLQRQMAELDQTQREIFPLILNMIKRLDLLSQADLPFLEQERRMRIEQLQVMMDRADVTLGEKYRRVLEAYQVEIDYGRTIEAYRGELITKDRTKTVDFLRLGRIGLYYLSLDRLESGYWDQGNRKWVMLPADYNRQVRNGLRIARQQAAPDLLRLPVAAAQEVAQ